MARFVLVHGAWHGAWCWDELIPVLEALGHTVHAIDLPGGGSDPAPDNAVTLDAWAQRVVEAVEAQGGPVWLVGHSMGGGAITQAAELVSDRLAGLVYVSAVLPKPGETLMEALYQEAPSLVNQFMVIDEAGARSAVRDEGLRESFYHLCSDAQFAKAKTLLRPWQAISPAFTPVTLTPERGQRVPRYFVECLRDRCVDIATQRRMYRAVGVDGLISLDCDHSPFWSDTEGLARALDGFTKSARGAA